MLWVLIGRTLTRNLSHSDISLELAKDYLCIKGGYLDFPHLTKLKNIYITEIYMKKQYKSSKTKNHRI